jgi:hypothetical protein
VTNNSRDLFNTDVVLKVNKDYQDLFEFLTFQTGLNLMENGLRDIWKVHDNLFCEVRTVYDFLVDYLIPLESVVTR